MEYKSYLIEREEGGTASLVIRHTGKGSLPTMLSGKFTTAGNAIKAVDMYLSTKKTTTKED